MAVKLKAWDTTDYLKTDEDRAAYLEACLAEAGDDPLFIAKALGNIARAKGLTESLSSEINPSLGETLKMIKALGIRLHAEAAPL
jgi:DNA-binding phage protein